jgi:hypothetical protein
MDIEIIGNTVPILEGGERVGYTYRARVAGLDGWTVEFDIPFEPSRITRLELRPDRRSAPTLSTTMLRHLNPSGLVNAAADPFLLEGDGPTTRWRSGRPDEYLAALSEAVIKTGAGRGRNMRLGEMFGRKASQISDDLGVCRMRGWLVRLESDGPWTLPTHGQAREFRVGPRLIDWREAQS